MSGRCLETEVNDIVEYLSAGDRARTRTERSRPGSLLDKAEVRSERFYFVRAQFAGNQRHQRLYARMISFAPLLEPALQIEIGQSSQTRNVSHTLGVRAVTGIAGHNVGFRNPLQIDCSSPGREIPVAVVGSFRI